MTTSLTTFERDVRECLLDVIHAQWHDLGVPFATAQSPSDEVIDPEALLWCSLEFLPTEPRLRESVVAWLRVYGQHVIRQRLKRWTVKGEPRTGLWLVLTNPKRAHLTAATEHCHGLDSPDEVEVFRQRLSVERARSQRPGKDMGRPATRPSTSLLWARDLLGSDIRHFLLVYLLANPSGGKLKTVQRWSGYSYRSISETATRWEAARVLAIDHGFCRLTNPEPWHALLPSGAERGVIVDWFGVFDACVRLLRALAKAERKGLALDSAVVKSHCREASEALSSSVLGQSGARARAVENLQDLLSVVLSGPSADDRMIFIEGKR